MISVSFRLFRVSFLSLMVMLSVAPLPGAQEFDIVVYGGTPGGIEEFRGRPD